MLETIFQLRESWLEYLFREGLREALYPRLLILSEYVFGDFVISRQKLNPPLPGHF